MVAAATASSRRASRFASKHYDQCGHLRKESELPKGGHSSVQAPVRASPVLLVSPHPSWFSATTLSLNHFSSHPSEAGNSGLTSHKRTVTELKIDVSPDWFRGLRRPLMAGLVCPPHTPRQSRTLGSGSRRPPPEGSRVPTRRARLSLAPGALRVRVFSLSPTAPGQRSPTSCPRKQARGGCVAGRGVVGLVLVGT